MEKRLVPDVRNGERKTAPIPPNPIDLKVCRDQWGDDHSIEVMEKRLEMSANAMKNEMIKNVSHQNYWLILEGERPTFGEH
jgi:hypothetical protein